MLKKQSLGDIINYMKNFICTLLIFLFVLFPGLSCQIINQDMVKIQMESPPKYPVVLVHGIVAYDGKRSVEERIEGVIDVRLDKLIDGRLDEFVEKHVNFWGRIPQVLEANGTKVFFGNTDSWGNIESNAEILHATIEKVLSETNSEKVNIIAHSKGGIDSRYMIWKYDYGDKVASLTTISTPHHGAEIADMIYNTKLIHTVSVEKALEVFGKFYGDVSPDVYGLNYQLTTVKMAEFNKQVVMDDRVYYQSYYTTMNNAFDDLVFYYSYLYIKNIKGANDGIVSARSAQWGDNVHKINGGISHAEILDYKKKKISGINIPDIYLNIVNELAKKGF